MCVYLNLLIASKADATSPGTAYLIDMHVFQNIYAVSQVDDSNSCSSMPFIALKAYNTNESSLSDVSVSQSLNIVYHGPAQLYV